MKKIPEPILVLLILASIPVISGLISRITSGMGVHQTDVSPVLLTFIVLCILLLFGIAVFSLITLHKALGIKLGSIEETRNEIYKNDINKVADKILFYQNSNVKDLDVIIESLKKESKENSKLVEFAAPKLNLPSYLNNINYFILPKDMKIKEENNEIIIEYKKLIYNVNKGEYIHKQGN